MQRAQNNIDEIFEDFRVRYHRLRQGKIDEELFDVLAGFEALKRERKKKPDRMTGNRETFCAQGARYFNFN